MTWHQKIGSGIVIVSWAEVIGLGVSVFMRYSCASFQFGGLSVIYYWRLPPEGLPNETKQGTLR